MLARSKILHLLIKKMMEIMIQSSKVVFKFNEMIRLRVLYAQILYPSVWHDFVLG